MEQYLIDHATAILLETIPTKLVLEKQYVRLSEVVACATKETAADCMPDEVTSDNILNAIDDVRSAMGILNNALSVTKEYAFLSKIITDMTEAAEPPIDPESRIVDNFVRRYTSWRTAQLPFEHVTDFHTVWEFNRQKPTLLKLADCPLIPEHTRRSAVVECLYGLRAVDGMTAYDILWQDSGYIDCLLEKQLGTRVPHIMFQQYRRSVLAVSKKERDEMSVEEEAEHCCREAIAHAAAPDIGQVNTWLVSRPILSLIEALAIYNTKKHNPTQDDRVDLIRKSVDIVASVIKNPF